MDNARASFSICRFLTTSAATTTAAFNEPLLLRLSTLLFQLRDAPQSRLESRLESLPLPSPFPHEFYLHLCSRFFSASWKPILRFSNFAESKLNFSHTPATAAVLLSSFSSSCHVSLLWSSFNHFLLHQNHLVNLKTILIVTHGLAEANEIKKILTLFALIAQHLPDLHNVDTLNSVVEVLIKKKLVAAADAVVAKIKSLIQPNEITYRFLVIGYCRSGELFSAVKIWNRMAGEEIEPDTQSYYEIVVTLFKNNRVVDAMEMFKAMRSRRFCGMSADSYKIVIDWMSKEGKVVFAHMVFAEMLKRGFQIDGSVLGHLIYGLLVRKRVREAVRVSKAVREPDIFIYHSLIQGFLQLKRPGDATEVFREMVRQGVEPIMHTYVMLLQGHLGKRGRGTASNSSVNFESIFVGGLVKAGKLQMATKFVERTMWSSVEVPRFDYNKFLYEFSNEEGIVMFEEVGMRLKKAGMVDLGDIFLRYGEKMTTRDRRRRIPAGCSVVQPDCLQHSSNVEPS